jgi:hypothetical protein
VNPEILDFEKLGSSNTTLPMVRYFNPRERSIYQLGSDQVSSVYFYTVHGSYGLISILSCRRKAVD